MESFLFQSGIVSASLQVVLDRFTTFVQKELGLLLGADNELKKLERTLLKVNCLVDVNAGTNHHHHNKAQQLWLRDLHSALHDAEDLLDEISLEILKLSSKTANLDFISNKDQVRNLVFSQFKFNIPSEITKMQQKLEDIAGEMDVSQTHSSGKVQTSSLVDESCVIGRENDKNEIVRLLLDEGIERRGNVLVVAIVGMGGVGKTTLAQFVFNDVNVVGNFDLRIWVSVSADCTVERITRSIIECACRERVKLSDFELIQTRLKEILEGRKILIVLDGVWNEDVNDWDILCLPLKAAAPGSRILVTTRSMFVSRVVATTPPYHLQLLSDGHYWELIKRRAFSSMDQDGSRLLELGEIGFKIAQKCNGLSLAARVLGDVLRFKYDETEWNAMLKSKIWDLPEKQNQIIPTLKLSYDHLAPGLKRCFAYCSIFPANFEFIKDDVVQLWVSEGFIQPRGLRRAEEVGNEYFDFLFQSSFFQFSHLNLESQQVYKMHSLIHDLAHFVSDEVCFRMDNGMSLPCSNLRNARHSSLFCKDIKPETLKVFQKCVRLRTFILLHKGGYHMDQIPYEFFLNLCYMRVLNLSFSNITELPDSIGTLKHLRHLDVSETHIDILPESITNLYGIETLKLKNCFKLLHLPKNMKNLTHLRHLEFDIKRQINSMPMEFGKLTNLQTLSAFVVGKEKGRCIEELKDMRFLHGSICITNLENVANVKEAVTAKLEQKPDLEGLELQWNVFKDGMAEQQILAGLRPHNMITWLTITGYGGFMFPSWLGNPTLCKIERIVLQNCRYCKVFPSLGQLPMLKHLYIEEMHDLIYMEGESDNRGSYGFPYLQSLTFHSMQSLQEWRGLKSGDMPNLSQLNIVDCPNLYFLPALHYLARLEGLEICYCPKLQCLPTEGLPNSLKSLIIIDCSILRERCRVPEGEDWSKIQSIPKVEIDYEMFW